MNYNFEYHDVTKSEALETFTKEQIDKLVDKYDFIVRADIFFKTENTSSDTTGMKCGIRVSAPGPRLFAETSTGDFYESVKKSVKEVARQLQKRKEKMKTH
ncbi:MAG: ribosome-associated translation inhibitor RaiA [Leeuwenhoekiella sp.]